MRYIPEDFVDVLIIATYIANSLTYVGLRIGKQAMVLGFKVEQWLNLAWEYLAKFEKCTRNSFNLGCLKQSKRLCLIEIDLKMPSHSYSFCS